MKELGFSLVELSIVLVILGLITGGVVVGQNLIRAAELREVGDEIHLFKQAIAIFEDKYFALPGDMDNATDYWGKANSSHTVCLNTISLDTKTCNGDADGKIQQVREGFLFWKHLSNAGLINGTYNNTKGPDGNVDAVIGVNVPASKLTNAGWGLEDNNLTGTLEEYAININKAFLEIGADDADNDKDTDQPVLTPTEAYNIDKKIDDGAPAGGNIIARYWNDVCAFANDGNHSNTNFDASYKVSDDRILCSLSVLNIF